MRTTKGWPWNTVTPSTFFERLPERKRLHWSEFAGRPKHTKAWTHGASRTRADTSCMKVSVITPTRLAPDRLPWLVTLHAQVMAEDLAVEHVIVVDGAGPHGVPSELSDAVIVAPGRRLGAAAARNFGLLVASGDVITSADDDDELPEESLAVRARALQAASSSGVRWVAGDTVAFDDASGTQTRWKYDTPYGWCRPGLTLEVCPDPAGRVPLGPTTMMVDAVLLRQLGGWMALPQGEDLG